jgi:hypothetical protein
VVLNKHLWRHHNPRAPKCVAKIKRNPHQP